MEPLLDEVDRIIADAGGDVSKLSEPKFQRLRLLLRDIEHKYPGVANARRKHRNKLTRNAAFDTAEVVFTTGLGIVGIVFLPVTAPVAVVLAAGAAGFGAYGLSKKKRLVQKAVESWQDGKELRHRVASATDLIDDVEREVARREKAKRSAGKGPP